MAKTHDYKTILIADDEFALVNTLDMVLTQQGYRVVTAYTGTETLSSINAIVPDLIILDLMMPLVDGLEILERMRQSSSLKSIPVILTGEVTPQASRQKYRWNLWLGKPFHFAQLLDAIVQLIGPA